MIGIENVFAKVFREQLIKDRITSHTSAKSKTFQLKVCKNVKLEI